MRAVTAPVGEGVTVEEQTSDESRVHSLENPLITILK